jgi:hypothetical protein
LLECHSAIDCVNSALNWRGISSELHAVEEQCAGLSFISASEDLMEVSFDEVRTGRAFDFRPLLPLLVRC